jgi:hypothetical protein
MQVMPSNKDWTKPATSTDIPPKWVIWFGFINCALMLGVIGYLYSVNYENHTFKKGLWSSVLFWIYFMMGLSNTISRYRKRKKALTLNKQ